jgi:hypothetical protein
MLMSKAKGRRKPAERVEACVDEDLLLLSVNRARGTSDV